VFAIVAAIIFAIAFVLDITGESSGNFFTGTTLTVLGLFFVALHLAPLGTVRRGRWRR
jgi:hypothetical protein